MWRRAGRAEIVAHSGPPVIQGLVSLTTAVVAFNVVGVEEESFVSLCQGLGVILQP